MIKMGTSRKEVPIPLGDNIMTTNSTLANADWSVADLLERFGPIAHRRIRQNPPPGCATEQDVLDIHDREDRLYELVDGVLVEKAMGMQESFLAVLFVRLLGNYVDRLNLGFVLGADGMVRLAPGLIRIPDVSFISWNKFPNRRIPDWPMLQFAPDLAVEILSPSNTPKEMDHKVHDYFNLGVKLVWYVDPVKRTVQVITSSEQYTLLEGDQTLTGDPLLPGFVLPLKDLFASLEA